MTWDRHHVKGSVMFSTNTPNIPPFVTDCQIHLYSASNSGSVQVYHDNGTASTNSTLYAPWVQNGSQVSYNLGYTTQGSPLRSISVANGTTLYVLVVYSAVNGFIVNYKTGSPFGYADMRNDAYGDLGVFTMLASITTSASISAGSGGTTTISGNGGANPRVKTA